MFGKQEKNHQTIRKLIVSFGSLFDTIVLNRFNKNGEISEKIKVPISYAAKSKVIRLASIDQKKPTSLTLPRISFNMSSLSYDSSRKKPKTSGIAKRGRPSKDDIRFMYSPVPYNFSFDLTIYCKFAEDGTNILENILPFFTPDFTYTIIPIEELDYKLDVPVTLTSVSLGDEYEGSGENRRIITWDLSFDMKAEIYPEVKDVKPIKSSEITVNIPENNIDKFTGKTHLKDSDGIPIAKEDEGRLLSEIGDSKMSDPKAESLTIKTIADEGGLDEDDDFGFQSFLEENR